MKVSLVTTKLPPTALSKLRAIAAVTDEKQYAVHDRLISAEYKKLHMPPLPLPTPPTKKAKS